MLFSSIFVKKSMWFVETVCVCVYIYDDLAVRGIIKYGN